MPVLQFNHAHLDACASISNDGQHIFRILSFDDGTRKQLGCFLGKENSCFDIVINGGLAQRFEVTEGSCIIVNDDGQKVYLRKNQSFVIANGASIFCDEILQYVLHFEG